MEEKRNFKRNIIDQITTYTEGLPDDIIDPILDDISAAIDNIEIILINLRQNSATYKK